MLRLVLLAFSVFTIDVFAGEVSGKVTVLLQDREGKWSPSKDNSGAVVYVTGFEEKLKDRPAVHLDQENKSFVPRVVAVAAGDSVIFRNKDTTYHNVWSISKPKPFDLGTYKAPEQRSVVFDKPGMVGVFCNIHPEMISTVLVLKNTKYFVTKSNGEYAIKNIPDGNFQLRVWTEGGEPVVKPLNVTANSKSKVDFTAKSVLRSKEHMNKDGKPYEGY